MYFQPVYYSFVAFICLQSCEKSQGVENDQKCWIFGFKEISFQNCSLHRGLFYIKWLRIIFWVGKMYLPGLKCIIWELLGPQYPCGGRWRKVAKCHFLTFFFLCSSTLIHFLYVAIILRDFFRKFDIFHKMTNFWTPFWSILVAFLSFFAKIWTLAPYLDIYFTKLTF